MLKFVELRQVVGDTCQLSLRRYEPSSAAHRVGDRMIHVETIALDLFTFGRMRKAREFEQVADFKTMNVCKVRAQRPLRDLFIGFAVVLAVIVHQRLVTIDFQRRTPEVTCITQRVVLVEDVFGRFVDVRREVGNVVTVGDLVVIDIEVKAVPMALCLHLGAIATLLRFMIFGQIIVSEFAVEIFVHVAQFVAQDHPTLGHDARRKRVVVVRGDVPVNRDSHIQATGRTHSERRR